MPSRSDHPLPPRLGDELSGADAAELAADDEWIDLRIGGEVQLDGGALELEGCHLVGAALTGSVLDRLRATDVLFEDCDLSGVVADETDLLRVELRGCRMRGIVLPQARLNDVRVATCSLDDASLRLASGARVEITESSLRDADLYGVHLTGAWLTRCDLSGVELSAAELPGTRLQGSMLDGVRGAEGLRGVVIDSAQVGVLARQVFAALDIVIDDADG